MGHGVPLWVTAGPKRGRHLTRREPGKLPSNAVSQLWGLATAVVDRDLGCVAAGNSRLTWAGITPP
jgi:hypothetical protein